MTKEEINQLILLIFSEDEEDFKLALNMIMKMECMAIDLDVFIGHCNNLLIANLKCSARVKVLISSMGSVLLDKGYHAAFAASTIERWDSTYKSIIDQVYKKDGMTGTGLTHGYSHAGTATFPGISPYTRGLTDSPLNAGATLTNNGTGNQKSPPF